MGLTQHLFSVSAFAVVLLHTSHAEVVHAPDYEEQCSSNDQSKPPGTPPRGKNSDAQSRTGDTPTALPGCCLYMKYVTSSRQSCIVHHPLITAGLIPLMIQSVKLVAITVYRIIRITKCCELHRERALLVREGNVVCVA